MKKRILFASVLLLLLSTYNIQKSAKLNSGLNIDKIYIENIKFIDEINIKKKLSFLYETNLFLLNEEYVKLKLNEEYSKGRKGTSGKPKVCVLS